MPAEPTVRLAVKPHAPVIGAGAVVGRPRSDELTFALVLASTPKLSRRVRMEEICASVRAAFATSGIAIEAPETKSAVEKLKKVAATFVEIAFLNLILIII